MSSRSDGVFAFSIADKNDIHSVLLVISLFSFIHPSAFSTINSLIN